MGSLALALLTANLGLVIEGSITCPTPDEVGVALQPLLREEISGTDDRLVLSWTSAHWLKIKLVDSRGELLAARTLPPLSSCAAQAHRVAVIAAAWQAELSEEPLPPGPEVKESEESERGARLWPLTTPHGHPTPGYAELGLRLSYVSVGGLAAGFQLGGGAVWGHWGFESTGWAQFSRTYNLVQNGIQTEGGFFRVAAEIGPTVLVRMEYPAIQLRAQGVASCLLVNGGTQFDPGAEVGVRFLVGGRPVSGFLDAAVTLWPDFLSSSPSFPLSPVEFFVSLGLVVGGT